MNCAGTVIGVMTICPDDSSLFSASASASTEAHIFSRLSKDDNSFVQHLLPHLPLISFVHISEKVPLVH